ncbi:phage tail tape measure protein [Microbacterium sp. MMO-10]|uniref:phage tail tape measure protein n=1 Tax=Microbacterium sp. MMO-10 TaxID=3081272 RepID=UPI00301A11FF
MSERVVKVRLSAQVAEYTKGMEEASRKTREVGSEAEKLAQKREAFNTLGAAGVAAGTAMLAGAGLAAKAAVDWQTAWTGVTKTVNGTPAQLAELEQSLRGLTSILPASHEEIAAVAEAAGQLGIETPNVTAFTKTMIDMGESTNLSAETAATSLARFMNIMGTGQDKVSNLGSAIVGLGNNFATTESEIMDMAMRLAGAGKQVGLTEGQVLGLATSLSSVGIEAEAGGSAVSKVLIDIAASAESGGAKLDKYASAAGMTSEKFKELWKSNPAEALSAFVKGLANAEAQGSSTLGILSDLGITEVRMRDALLRSSSAADQFAGAMEMGNKEFEKGNALTDEAAKRYATAESKIRIAGNAVRDAAIDFGNVLLPALAGTADAVKNLADFMGDLPDPVKGLIMIGGSLAGVLLLIGGAALIAVPKIVAFKVAMAELGITGTGVRGGLGRVASFLGGPWGIAMLAAVVAVQGLRAANEAGTASAEDLRNALLTATDAADVFATATQGHSVEKFLNGDGSGLLKNLPALMDQVREAHKSSGIIVGDAADALLRINDVGKALAETADQDLPRASAAFQMLAKGMNSAQAAELLKNMGPEFHDALVRAASGAGMAADDTKLLDIVMGRTALTAKTAADAYMDEAKTVEDLSSQMSKLIDQINEANGVNQDAVTANAQYQEALAGISDEVQRQRDEYEKLNGTTDGFVASLDESTAAGASNAAMLSDVARSAQDAAKAQYEVDKTTMSAKDATDKYAGTLAAQRQAFIDSAIEAGFNADQVQTLADKVFALPSEKELKILAETATAQSAIDQFITLNDGKRVRVFVDAEGGQSYRVGSTTVSPNANGGVYDLGVKAFADGGFEPGIYGYRPGGIHKFAEKFSEAYMSMDPARLPRSREVWYEAGSRLGLIRQQGSGEQLSLEGLAITGTLEIGGDGLGRIVDGKITAYDTAVSRGVGRRR